MVKWSSGQNSGGRLFWSSVRRGLGVLLALLSLLYAFAPGGRGAPFFRPKSARRLDNLHACSKEELGDFSEWRLLISDAHPSIRSFTSCPPHLEKPRAMAKKIHKVSPLRPTLLRRTIAIASTHYLCLAFFHSSFIKYSRTSHKKRLGTLGHAAQRNDAAQMKFIMELWVSDRMEMIIA